MQAKQRFPSVPWGPTELVRVMAFGVAAAVAFNAGNQALLHLAAAQDASSSLLTGASVHLAQEGLLAALLPCMLVAALWGRPGAVGQLFRAQWDGRAVRQTLIACAVVFPVADPLLYSAAAPAVQAILGAAGAPASSAFVDAVHAAGQQGAGGALALHLAASGLVGPVWEEIFWRAFFLSSLTKVLPLPACVGFSALNFAALHLSPASFPSLLLLGATCDWLYLRSGGNLLAPLLLHCLWNSGQVLGIALLGKDSFV